MGVVGVTSTDNTSDSFSENEEDLVVVDDEKFIYTAGPIVGSYEAAMMVVAKLYGDGIAAHIEQSVLFYQNPHPLFNVGRASKASRGLLLAAKFSIAPINPIVRRCAQKGLAETHRHRAAKNGNVSKGSNKMTKVAIVAGVVAAALVVQRMFISPVKR